MNLKSVCGVAILATLLLGCAAGNMNRGSTSSQLSQFSWLLGTWETSGLRGSTIETWSQDDKGVLRGASYKVVAGDTTLSETSRLEQDSTGLYFVANVPHNQGEVRFRLVELSRRGALFSNPHHDYPTSVQYRPVGIDSLYARISGKINGKPHIIEYRYRRLNRERGSGIIYRNIQTAELNKVNSLQERTDQ